MAAAARARGRQHAPCALSQSNPKTPSAIQPARPPFVLDGWAHARALEMHVWGWGDQSIDEGSQGVAAKSPRRGVKRAPQQSQTQKRKGQTHTQSVKPNPEPKPTDGSFTTRSAFGLILLVSPCRFMPLPNQRSGRGQPIPRAPNPFPSMHLMFRSPSEHSARRLVPHIPNGSPNSPPLLRTSRVRG